MGQRSIKSTLPEGVKGRKYATWVLRMERKEFSREGGNGGISQSEHGHIFVYVYVTY